MALEKLLLNPQIPPFNLSLIVSSSSSIATISVLHRSRGYSNSNSISLAISSHLEFANRKSEIEFESDQIYLALYLRTFQA
ncbi:hypothetical protein LOK49_LG07G02154 [Camellia lanceoleosa]|uniref:Uncharacterized protein n=1 Tax=Camellia lanceoleosa TaxID=1840588 RepID=A0ACC0H5N1_9ERIC|nr:hypothetical protein LOK49_LG07G02154 [Camellia lanceoleosa]